MASGTYASKVAGIPRSDERGFCPKLKLLAISPDVKPDRAFPNGNPIKPSHEPNPKGQNIIPGNAPTSSPEIKPKAGPPKKPAIKAAIKEKSKAIPGEIGPR